MKKAWRNMLVWTWPLVAFLCGPVRGRLPLWECTRCVAQQCLRQNILPLVQMGELPVRLRLCSSRVVRHASPGGFSAHAFIPCKCNCWLSPVCILAQDCPCGGTIALGRLCSSIVWLRLTRAMRLIRTAQQQAVPCAVAQLLVVHTSACGFCCCNDLI